MYPKWVFIKLEENVYLYRVGEHDFHAKEVNAATDTLEQNQLDITSVTYNCLFNK